MMAPNAQELNRVTEPTRSPNFPWLGALMAAFQHAMHPDQPQPQGDTSWHDQMVRDANQSFQQQPAAQAAPAMPIRSYGRIMPGAGSGYGGR
jgi:uncharacterized membrane protein YccC